MPERTTQNNSDVEQVALAALGWRESLKRNGVSPGEAVGHILCQQGRGQLQQLLASYSRDEVAQSIDYYLGKLTPAGKENFQHAWGKVFTGVLIKHIDRTPADGWSTQTFLRDLNLVFEGTPLPPIIFKTASIYQEDNNQTVFITKTLIANKQVGCFFNINELFEQLTPVMKILEAYCGHALTSEVIEQGQFAQKCLNYIKQLSRPH